MKKKKISYSRLLCLLATIVAAVSFFQGISGFAATNDEVTIVLHKRALREADMPEFDPYQNDGNKADEEADIYTKTTPLEGAIFDVYDVTQLYLESEFEKNDFLDRVNEMSCQDAINYLYERQIKPIIQKYEAEGKTDTEGVAQFRVPSYNRQLQSDAAYLIVETGVEPTAGVTVDLKRARPFALVLPLLDPVTQQAMTTIHLYPKNLSYLRNPYFYKLGKKNDGSEIALQGAVFGLYRYNSKREKEYLHKEPTVELKNKWLTTNEPSKNSDVARFISDSQGLVALEHHYLPAGTYYFDEFQGVAGFNVSEKARAIEVVIPDSPRDDTGKLQPITVNGYKMEENDNGEITDAAKEKREPRVYNNEEPDLPDTKGESVSEKGRTTSNEKRQQFLPETGEKRTQYLIILGVILFCIVLFIRYRSNRSKMS